MLPRVRSESSEPDRSACSPLELPFKFGTGPNAPPASFSPVLESMHETSDPAPRVQ